MKDRASRWSSLACSTPPNARLAAARASVRPHPAPLEIVLEEPEMGVDLPAELTLGSGSPEGADQTEPRAS